MCQIWHRTMMYDGIMIYGRDGPPIPRNDSPTPNPSTTHALGVGSIVTGKSFQSYMLMREQNDDILFPLWRQIWEIGNATTPSCSKTGVAQQTPRRRFGTTAAASATGARLRDTQTPSAPPVGAVAPRGRKARKTQRGERTCRETRGPPDPRSDPIGGVEVEIPDECTANVP